MILLRHTSPVGQGLFLGLALAGGGIGISHSAEAAEPAAQGGTLSLDVALDEAALQQLEATLNIEFDGQVADSVVVKLDARSRADLVGRVEPDSVEMLGQLSESSEIRVGYLEWALPWGALRVGKQHIVWGGLDGFRVLDQINPQSFRTFILEDFDQARVGVWAVQGIWRTAESELNAVVSADRSVHDIPMPPARFAPTSPRFALGSMVDSGALGPRQVSSEGLLAARYVRYAEATDWSIVAIWGPDPQPAISFDASRGRAQQVHAQRLLLGGSVAVALDSWVLRAEAAYSPSRRFNVAIEGGPRVTDESQLVAAVSADWAAPGGVFVNVQWIYDWVPGAGRTLRRPEREHIGSLLLRRRFDNDSWSTWARWYGTSEGGSLIRTALGWTPSDSLSIEVGFDVFSGSDHSVFGQFDSKDQMWARFVRYF